MRFIQHALCNSYRRREDRQTLHGHGWHTPQRTIFHDGTTVVTGSYQWKGAMFGHKDFFRRYRAARRAAQSERAPIIVDGDVFFWIEKQNEVRSVGSRGNRDGRKSDP